MQVLHGIPAVLVALVDWAAGEQDCAARVRVVQDMAAKRDCRVLVLVLNCADEGNAEPRTPNTVRLKAGEVLSSAYGLISLEDRLELYLYH